MNRRQVLASTGALLPALAGCSALASSRTEWETTLGDDVVSPLVYRDDTVWAATRDGKFHALDPSDGSTTWSERLQDRFLVGPAVTSGISDGMVLGHYDLVWGRSQGDGTWKLDNWAESGSVGPVTALDADGGDVYLARLDGTVQRLNARTHASVWPQPTELEAHASVLTAKPDRVVASPVDETDGSVVALAADDGSRLWEEAFEGISHSAARRGRAYVAARDGVLALDIEDGSELWGYPLSNARSVAPVHNGAYAVAGHRDDATLVAFDRDGEKRWETDIEWTTSTGTAPAATTDRVYVPEYNGQVSAFDADSGDRAWAYELGDDEYAITTPLVRNGTVYVGISDSVVAFDS